MTENVALTYNHLTNDYSFTMIGTGMSLHRTRFKTVRSAKKEIDNLSEVENRFTLDDIKKAKDLYNNLIKQKQFYKN